jgi:hypothetical protein
LVELGANEARGLVPNVLVPVAVLSRFLVVVAVVPVVEGRVAVREVDAALVEAGVLVLVGLAAEEVVDEEATVGLRALDEAVLLIDALGFPGDGTILDTVEVRRAAVVEVARFLSSSDTEGLLRCESLDADVAEARTEPGAGRAGALPKRPFAAVDLVEELAVGLVAELPTAGAFRAVDAVVVVEVGALRAVAAELVVEGLTPLPGAVASLSVFVLEATASA